MSSFDEVKDYYVFEYVVDTVTGEPTNHEGSVQDFVKGTDMWSAMIDAGYDDTNKYGCNRMDNEHLEKFVDGIKNERKHLKMLSKKLKVLTDAHDAEMKKLIEDRECPNGCGKMDEKFRCDQCGYGREAEGMIKDIDKLIKEAKKNGDDTSQLEALKDALAKTLE